jgi:hypothetical protein
VVADHPGSERQRRYFLRLVIRFLAAGFLVAAFFFGERLAAFFVVAFFTVFFAAFFFGERLAAFLVAFFFAVFFLAEGFFFGERFAAVFFVTVFFLAVFLAAFLRVAILWLLVVGIQRILQLSHRIPDWENAVQFVHYT